MDAMQLSMLLLTVVMAPWVIAYFWFPRVVRRILGGVDVSGTLLIHVVRVARFVAVCAWSHVVMAACELLMWAGMASPELTALAASLRILAAAILLAGGAFSIFAVARLAEHASAIRTLIRGDRA